MNIVIKPFGSDLCYCRPDTTWERENKDFYSPECVNEILYSPVIFARVAKAGKCISEKFAERYYDAIGCGMLMYCNTSEGVSSCVDHTSILPMTLYNPAVLEDNMKFTLKKNGKCISAISAGGSEWRNLLEHAICKSSQLTSLRIGDFVAVELANSETIACKAEGTVSVQGEFCENTVFDFKIIL